MCAAWVTLKGTPNTNRQDVFVRERASRPVGRRSNTCIVAGMQSVTSSTQRDVRISLSREPAAEHAIVVLGERTERRDGLMVVPPFRARPAPLSGVCIAMYGDRRA